jgi:ribonuclease R
VTALKNDYYHFDAVKRCLRGERSGTIYRLGDQVKVKVMRVDIEKREIDFDLVTGNEKKKSLSRKKIVKKKEQKNISIKKGNNKKVKVSINKKTVKNKPSKRFSKKSFVAKKKKR